MSQADKSGLYNRLKDEGYPFDPNTKHYREYTTKELAELCELNGISTEEEIPEELEAPLAGPSDDIAVHAYLNAQQGEETPIRTDERGWVWFRDEVRKPAYPQPRKRRVLSYIEPGVETRTVINDKFIESFEVAGTGVSQGQVKITMPSYQVGVYKDPNMPFKIHVYNDQRGFDLFEVQKYYGGADLVPDEIKRVYIQNDLCYDIRTTVRAIQTAYRQLMLQKGN